MEFIGVITGYAIGKTIAKLIGMPIKYQRALLAVAGMALSQVIFL